MAYLPTALLKVERTPEAIVLYLGVPFWIIAAPAALFTAVVVFQGVPWPFVAILWAAVALIAQWRDLWACSQTEPVIRHTPTLAGFSLGSRTYRITPAAYFRVRDYRPGLSWSWPPVQQLLLCMPGGEEIRVTVSHNETYLTRVEQEMKSALSRC